MTAQRSFEDRLARAFDAWADEATVAVDPTSLAAVVATRTTRRPAVGPIIGLRRSWLVPVGLTLLLLTALASVAIVGAMLLHQPHRYDGFYEPAPDMSIARDQPILVPLHDGRVLIAGGQRFSVGDPTGLELFDPATGSYEQLSGDIPVGVGTGVELGDGRVFLVATELPNQLTRAYVIDVAARVSHEPMPGVALGLFGTDPSIVRLLDGSVLITGGMGDPQTTALLFDPAHNSFTQTGSMNEPRVHQAMAVLPDGNVLVAGGISGHMADVSLDDAEIYDPTKAVFTLVGHMPTVRGQAWTMTLPDGRAMVIHAGPTDSLIGEGVGQPSPVDFYYPTSKTFEAGNAPDLPGQASYTALPDGRVLMAGSQLAAATDTSSVRRTAWSAIYDPIAGTVTPLGDPHAIFPSGAVLPDGRVLLAGGYYDSDTSSNRAVPWVEVLR